MRQERLNIAGIILIIYSFILGLFLSYIFLEQYLWVWLSVVLSIPLSVIFVGMIAIVCSKDKENHDMSEPGIIILFIILIGITSLTPFAYSSIQENKVNKAKEAQAYREAYQAERKSRMCSEGQKEAAVTTRAMLESFGKRDDDGRSVHYIWKSGWYALGYDKQLEMMRAIADTEFCLSNGRTTIMRIEYNGDVVAEATPMSGIQVVKSRP